MVMMVEDRPEHRTLELIRKLGIASREDAERYERCETAARLAPREVLEKIDGPEQKAEIEWIKEAHKKGFPSLEEWRNFFTQELEELIEATGGLDRIREWHNLEALCEELLEEEIEEMEDSERRMIETIGNIHERSPERRIEIINKINKKSEPDKNK